MILPMTLPQNQITDLYLWVHPDFAPVDEQILREWGEFIELLSYEQHTALVETGARGKRPEITDLENSAAKLLGQRYYQWSERFVRGSEGSHRRALAFIFNVEERIFPFSHQEEPKLFKSIYCYGLQPGACVYWQAFDHGLSSLADDSVSLGSSALRSLSWKSLPTRPESLEIIIRNGLLFPAEAEEWKRYLNQRDINPNQSQQLNPPNVAP